MLDLAGWIAPAATMIAAMMTAANLGTRVTGWGFALFSVGAIAWVIVALGSGQQNLLLSNGFLLLIDIVGIWRWLGREARYEAGAEAAEDESVVAPAPSLFALGTLNGRAVEGADGKVIGHLVDAMAACDSGTIAYLVIRRGGIGGVGERLQALGWEEIRMGEDRIGSLIDPASWERRPDLDPAHWPATREDAGVGR